MRWCSIVAIIVLLGQTAWAENIPEKRVALVVGNGTYENAGTLRNPTNDADAMAKTLKAIGFDVIEVKNTTKQQLERAVGEFGRRLAKDGVGLFFYSGHGMQANGRNFIIPVDAELANEGSLRIETTDVDLVLDQMAAAQTRVNLVILDACRNNKFEKRFRALSGGLAAVNDAPKGTLIAYATSPGKTASDGTGKNGPYTAALLKAITAPGLSAEEVFKQVRVSVTEETRNEQTPWELSSLTGTFYFVPPVGAQGQPPSSGTDPAVLELAYWQSVSSSGSIKAFHSYLARYPNGQFGDLAKLKITELETGTQKTAMVTPRPSSFSKPPSVANRPGDQLSAGKEAFDRKDYVTALKIWRPLAGKGMAEAQYEMGILFDCGCGVKRNYSEAFSWYRKAADQGYLKAQSAIGFDYVAGIGVEKDFTEAVKWYRKAAEQGDKEGQTGLGDMYVKGQGVIQDYAEATRWYFKAADQDEALAQHRLAIMYQNGQGVPRDLVQAYKWLNLELRDAGSQHARDPFAKFMLNDSKGPRGEMEKMMNTSQITESQRLSAEWIAAHSKNEQ